jgi:predicted Zn-dependent protease
LEVVILTTRESLALFPGGNQILISAGLLQRLTSEAEAAFLLTHEAGHVILEHQVTLRTQGGEDSEAELAQLRRTMELEADTFALEKINQAGYRPTAAITALRAVYRDTGTRRATDLGYPPLQERIQNLLQAATALPAHATGIQDRREFQRCRIELNT